MAKTGYDADGKAVDTKCEICGAESSVAFFKTRTGMRCLGCYSKYGEDWTPEEVD